MKCVMWCWLDLARCYAIAKQGFVGFERTGDNAVGRIEAEGDCLSVLICRVEGVAQVHEEGVAAPPKSVFDIRVGETSSVEEVRGRYANGVA